MRLKAYVVRGLIISSCTPENDLSPSQDVCTGLQRLQACKMGILPSPFPDGSSPSLREDTRTSPTGLGELASDEARVKAIPGPEPGHTPSSSRQETLGFLREQCLSHS